MTRDAKVGLLLAVSGVILVVAVFLIGDQEGVWESKYQLRIYYEEVEGLLPGAPVRLSGLRVGSVDEIRFSEEKPEQLEVTISVDEDVKQRIRADSKAYIGSLGLLGDKTMEITVGSPDSMMLEEGEMVKAGSSGSIQAIINQGGQVMANLKDASHEAKEIIEKINQGEGSLGLFVNDPKVYFDLNKLLDLTAELTEKLESGEGSFAKFVTDTAFYAGLTNFLTTTNSILDTLAHGEGTLPMLMKDPEPFRDLQAIVKDWRELTDQVKAGEGTAGRLLTDDSLYVNLSRTLDRTEALIRDFRENPGRYIKFSIF
jgi:phospholipid/cholesterol/gamma-HCH transport system substrate-binding protein